MSKFQEAAIFIACGVIRAATFCLGLVNPYIERLNARIRKSID